MNDILILVNRIRVQKRALERMGYITAIVDREIKAIKKLKSFRMKKTRLEAILARLENETNKYIENDI